MDYTLSVYQNEANLAPTEAISFGEVNNALGIQVEEGSSYLLQLLDKVKDGSFA
jgi:hypothetical protein